MLINRNVIAQLAPPDSIKRIKRIIGLSTMWVMIHIRGWNTK